MGVVSSMNITSCCFLVIENTTGCAGYRDISKANMERKNRPSKHLKSRFYTFLSMSNYRETPIVHNALKRSPNLTGFCFSVKLGERQSAIRYISVRISSTFMSKCQMMNRQKENQQRFIDNAVIIFVEPSLSSNTFEYSH